MGGMSRGGMGALGGAGAGAAFGPLEAGIGAALGGAIGRGRSSSGAFYQGPGGGRPNSYNTPVNELNPLLERYRTEGWGNLSDTDPGLYNHLVTYSAFKDFTGREPTQQELNQYAGLGGQARDYIRGVGDSDTMNRLGGTQYGEMTGLAGRQFGQASQLGQQQFGQANQLGQQQFGQSQNFITGDIAGRQAMRDKLANLLTQQATNSFQRTLPQTAEDYNAGKLLNSTGYQQEVARQQGYLGQDIANRVGQVGLQDIDLQTQQKAQALANLHASQQGAQSGLFGAQQGAQQGLFGGQSSALQARQNLGLQGLSRQFSIADFLKQAEIAERLGDKSTPKMGKGGGMGALGGAGAGASAGSAFGPWGALGGAALGAIGGGLSPRAGGS